MPQVYKDILEFDTIAGSYNTEFLVEGDIIIPENYPDILTVLAIDSRTYIDDIFLTSDKIQFEGRLVLQLLYLSEKDGEMVSVEKEVDYSQIIEEDIDKRARCVAKASVENLDYRIVNSRKLSIRAVVRIQSKLFVSEKKEVVVGGEESLGLQTLKRKVKIIRSVGQNTGEVFVKEKIELGKEEASFRKILRKQVMVLPEEAKVSENKVIVQGNLKCQILYISAEGDLKSQEVGLKYANFVDVPGALNYMRANTSEEVVDVEVTLLEDETGESRALDVEIIMKVHVEVYEEEERDIPVDAYGTQLYVEPLREATRALSSIKSYSSQFIVKTEVELPSMVKRIMEVFSSISISDYNWEKDKLILEGVLNYAVLYVSEDGGIKSYKDEYPFRTFLETDGEGEVFVEIFVTHVSYEINGVKEVELKFTLESHVEVLEELQLDFVHDLKEVDIPRAEAHHSIIIYMVQKGEKLWDIAKRYRVSVEDLITTNELSDEKVSEGEKLIIPVKR
jgi:LysM repeat protein